MQNWYFWARLIKGMDEKLFWNTGTQFGPYRGRGGGVVAPTESKGALTQG